MFKIKKVLALVLACVLTLGISLPSFATYSTQGGTWEITDYQTQESIIDFPVKVVYLSPDQVNALRDLIVETNGVKKALLDLGIQTFTSAIATTLKSTYGITLSPLAVYGWTCYQLASAAANDHFNKDFLDAKNNSSSGTVKYTTYRTIAGVEQAEFDPWDGSYMPEFIDFRYTKGFAWGTVTIGVYKMPYFQ